MMRAAKSTSMLWAAHVLPLYVVQFDVGQDEALKLLASLDLLDWVEGNKKDKLLQDLTMNYKSVFLNNSNGKGQCFIHQATEIPDQRCHSPQPCVVCFP